MPSKAELRRLMKLHRAKLEHEGVSSSQQESHLKQDFGGEELAATTTATTGQRNKPVKGILKASSVSSKPVASVGVSTLLAGYASSSDSEPDEIENDKSTEDTKQPSKPLEPSTSVPLSPSVGDGSERAKVRFHATVIDTKKKPPVVSIGDESSFKPPTRSFEPVSQQSKTAATTTTSTITQPNLDSAWQEFEALLTDDSGEPSNEASSSLRINDGASPALHDNPEQGEDVSTSAASESAAVAPLDDDVSAYAQVEQASYEARLARLRNKVKKRPLPSARQPDDSKDKLPPSSTTESSNLLAFVDESSDNNLSLLPSAPLGQLLRKKRARARALVGWDDETAKGEKNN